MRRVAAWLIAWLVTTSVMAAPQSRPGLVGDPSDHAVVAGDTLTSLAARFGVDGATIARRNGLTVAVRLKPGTTLRIDAVHVVPVSDRRIVVNIPQRMLFLTATDGVHAFPIAAGRRSWPTPLGAFTVDVKEEDPTWDVPISIQAEMRRAGQPVLQHVAPSPQNPLGRFWLGLSLAGIGIHGTNAPSSIYRLVTHGCIRVHPDQIGEVFALVPQGAEGKVVYEPLLLATANGRVYVEAHIDAYRRSPVTLARLRDMADGMSATARIDWTLAADAVARKEGVAVDVSRCADRR
jgi:L,D-transpeptidase ErfK/SrfK